MSGVRGIPCARSAGLLGTYLRSRHDVRRLDHVQESAVLRLVHGDPPVVKDEELFIGLAEQALLCLSFIERERSA